MSCPCFVMQYYNVLSGFAIILLRKRELVALLNLSSWCLVMIVGVLCLFLMVPCIGIAPITQITHMHNKNSNIQGRSLNVIKVIFHTIRNSS